MNQLGIELIPAGSPQARGRMERLWETWQGRLPQELRLAGIATVSEANAFLKRRWIPLHNQTWRVPPEGEGTAFVPYTGPELDRIFALVHDRVVAPDNCVAFKNLRLQILPSAWRYSFTQCKVKIYEHLDGTISIGYGPHTLGRYTTQGQLLPHTGQTESTQQGDTQIWRQSRSQLVGQR